MSHNKDESFAEHLGALYRALKRSALSIFSGFILCWSFSESIFEILKKPLEKHFPISQPIYLKESLTQFINQISPNLTDSEKLNAFNSLENILKNFIPKTSLYYQTPFEPFWVYLKVSFLSGFFIAFPLIFFFMWQFFSPAMKEFEKKTVVYAIFFATALFIGGALLGYFYVFPIIMDFAIGYSTESLIPILTMDGYFQIFSKILLGFGVVFELPLILIILALMNIVSSSALIRFFRFAIVIIFFISAIITPPDILSQVIMALPLIFLYGFSIIAVKFIEFRRK
ncbi:twin-arginine translocase subunit TatC [bacterium]|nr:twin-arginine translocase subunit TatC [bacterium]